MSSNRPTLKLFLDESVPRSVGVAFESEGHDVIYLKDAIPTGSPDLLVCATAQANEAVLVATDGDMRQIAKRNGVGGGRFKKLGLIKLSCRETQAANRVVQAMSLIEHEWLVSEEKWARRIFIDVGSSVIRTYR